MTILAMDLFIRRLRRYLKRRNRRGSDESGKNMVQEALMSPLPFIWAQISTTLQKYPASVELPKVLFGRKFESNRILDTQI